MKSKTSKKAVKKTKKVPKLQTSEAITLSEFAILKENYLLKKELLLAKIEIQKLTCKLEEKRLAAELELATAEFNSVRETTKSLTRRLQETHGLKRVAYCPVTFELELDYGE